LVGIGPMKFFIGPHGCMDEWGRDDVDDPHGTLCAAGRQCDRVSERADVDRCVVAGCARTSAATRSAWASSSKEAVETEHEAAADGA